jgi:hypothetical protein
VSQQDVDTVRDALTAFNSGDLARILTIADPQIEAQVPASISSEPDTYRGHERIRRYFESFTGLPGGGLTSASSATARELLLLQPGGFEGLDVTEVVDGMEHLAVADRYDHAEERLAGNTARDTPPTDPAKQNDAIVTCISYLVGLNLETVKLGSVGVPQLPYPIVAAIYGFGSLHQALEDRVPLNVAVYFREEGIKVVTLPIFKLAADEIHVLLRHRMPSIPLARPPMDDRTSEGGEIGRRRREPPWPSSQCPRGILESG